MRMAKEGPDERPDAALCSVACSGADDASTASVASDAAAVGTAAGAVSLAGAACVVGAASGTGSDTGAGWACSGWLLASRAQHSVPPQAAAPLLRMPGTCCRAEGWVRAVWARKPPRSSAARERARANRREKTGGKTVGIGRNYPCRLGALASAGRAGLLRVVPLQLAVVQLRGGLERGWVWL